MGGRKKFVQAVSQKLCNLDLTFDLAVVTLSLKIFSGLYHRKRKV